MAKQLTSNELHVLEENLDLFGSEPITAPNASRKPKNRKPIDAAKPPKQAVIEKVAKQQDAFTPQQRLAPAQSQATPESQTKEDCLTISRDTSAIIESCKSESSQKLAAIRANSATSAADLADKLGYEVLNYGMEKRDPALKNLGEALLDLGLEYKLGSQTLHWLQLKSDQSTGDILRHNAIELVMCNQWFDQEKHQIRRLKGIDYIDGCAKIAASLPLKDQTRQL